MKKAILYINPDNQLNHISPEIYGQFSEHLGRCIYDGIFVSEGSEIPNTNGIRNDVVDALRAIDIPVLRWPGGCFADEYHWRDGIGPRESRRKMVNTNWGGIVEDNSFGTHEFMELCDQLGCEPYIAVNMGSATVQEAAEWVEYLTASGDSDMANLRAQNGHKAPWNIKYLGIGNESWGCGGSMSVDYYANEYKKYQSFCKEYGENKLYKIACGPNAEDYNWTKGLMQRLNHWHTKGISLHYYTLPGDWEHKGSATDFTEEEYYITISRTLKIEEIMKEHLKIMDEFDPGHDIDLIVDEWGTWYDVEPGTNPGFLYQQNTMRDAIVAAINLNIFNKYSDRVSMANIAQVVNVLQAMILTEGVKILKTPTYEVFHMFKDHQSAALLESRLKSFSTGIGDVSIPALSESVSLCRESDSETGKKKITITLSNASLSEQAELTIQLPDSYLFDGEVSIARLHNGVHDCNTFEQPDKVVQIVKKERWEGNSHILELPPCSVFRISCYV